MFCCSWCWLVLMFRRVWFFRPCHCVSVFAVLLFVTLHTLCWSIQPCICLLLCLFAFCSLCVTWFRLCFQFRLFAFPFGSSHSLIVGVQCSCRLQFDAFCLVALLFVGTRSCWLGDGSCSSGGFAQSPISFGQLRRIVHLSQAQVAVQNFPHILLTHFCSPCYLSRSGNCLYRAVWLLKLVQNFLGSLFFETVSGVLVGLLFRLPSYRVIGFLSASSGFPAFYSFFRWFSLATVRNVFLAAGGYCHSFLVLVMPVICLVLLCFSWSGS